MANAYTPGGGGGRAADFTENSEDALSKPFDVSWPVNADAIQQINEMFDLLFKSMVKRHDELTALTNTVNNLSLSSDVLVASTTLTGAQINALSVTPVVLVAAVSGKILVPLHIAVEANTTSITTIGAGHTYTFQWANETASVLVTNITADVSNVRRKYFTSDALNLSITSDAGTDAIVGSPIDVRMNTACNGTHEARFTVTYSVIDAEIFPGA